MPARSNAVRRSAAVAGTRGVVTVKNHATALASNLPTPSTELRARHEQWLRQGWWRPETLPALIERALKEHGHREVRVWSRERPHRRRLSEILDGARRCQTALGALGIQPGDAVLVQLPNWAESLMCVIGTLFAGAVVVPLAPAYGPRERQQILAASGARILLIANRFGGRDFADEVLSGPGGHGELDATVFVGEGVPAGELALMDLLAASPPAPHIVSMTADDTALLAFTSGSTGEPKGVLHTSRSLVFEATCHGPLTLPAQTPHLVASPLAHSSGLISGFLVPMMRGEDIHLVDRWAPDDALAAIAEAGLSVGNGAPIFLQSLMERPNFDVRVLRQTRSVTFGGAPISTAACEEITQLGIEVIRAYGSTEHMVATGATLDDPVERRISTDGRALPGVELRIVDGAEQPVGPGVAGEVWSRGPDLCAGYLDTDATRESFSADGWFRTGDIGVLDSEGWLSIIDRRKDIIIRSGLNVGAREVELAVQSHSAIAEVAIVGRPDPRTGERVVAVVRQTDGSATLDVADLHPELAASGIAKFKWPEQVIRVYDLPRTPSGKVAKGQLRTALRMGQPVGDENQPS